MRKLESCERGKEMKERKGNGREGKRRRTSKGLRSREMESKGKAPGKVKKAHDEGESLTLTP